ncbi:MAG: VTT domain-containing protein, partial [Litorimonas sp.]
MLGFFGLSAIMIVLGRHYIALDGAQLDVLFGTLSESAWGLPVAIIVFCVGAFIGAPQWMLISASVLAFGPVQGGIYAWIATLTSAALDFWIARAIGAARIEKMNGQLLTKIMSAIRKNGFTTSFAVRLVPTGPFILVNFAAGMSNMKFTGFLAGTALGIIPKIMIVSLIGLGIVSGVNKSYMGWFFGGLAALVIGVTILAQRRLKS